MNCVILQIAPSSLLANISPNIDWSVFESFDPAPIFNLLRPLPLNEDAFEKELMKCIGYWANSLAWKSNGAVNEQDLRGIFGMKLLESYPKLHELFSNLKMFRKYVAVVCHNEYKDQLDKAFAQKNSVALMSSIDFEVPDGEGGFTRMIDLLQTDDVGNVFTLQDIKAVVTEEEYGLVLDHFVAGRSIRDLVKEDGGTKSSLGRITKDLKLKLAGYLHNWTPMMRSSTRPDRMRPDVLAAWNDTGATNIQPLYVCEHLQASEMVVGSQPLVDFKLDGAVPITDKFGLCPRCWHSYWNQIMAQIEETLKKL
jgi:hypothetical protein